MAAISKGTVAFSFGVDETYVGGTITSLSLGEEWGNVGEVRNETGTMISKRYDDIRKEGTMTVLLEDATVPSDALGSTFTYDSVVYYIDGISEARSNEGYAEYTFNIKEYENMSSVTIV